jgi:hypothetical protein
MRSNIAKLGKSRWPRIYLPGQSTGLSMTLNDIERLDDFADFSVIQRFIVFFSGPEGPPGLSRAENLHRESPPATKRDQLKGGKT